MIMYDSNFNSTCSIDFFFFQISMLKEKKAAVVP